MNTTRHVLSLWSVVLLMGSSMTPQANYFPTAAFGDPKASQEWIGLYSRYLEGLKEPSLFDRSQSGTSQSYRFFWLRSFHKPVAVRLDVTRDGAAVVTVKVGKAAGVSAVGEGFQKTTRALTKHEVDSFLDQIEAEGFWKLPSQEDPVSGPDGARWIPEGVKDGRYRAVHRWSPKGGAVRTLCLYLAVSLGGMKPADDEIY